MLTVFMNDAIEKHICQELDRLRKENDTLREWIKSSKEIPHCAVCGKPIENVSIQRMLRPHLWDCRECFQKKPRKIIALEQKFGLDILEILKETTRGYGNIKAQCDALGVSIPYFYAIVKKYCGENFIDFMAKHSVGKRKETYYKKIVPAKPGTGN
jgi:hypothetical protein